MDGAEMAERRGKFPRTVHVGFDMALVDPDSIDMTLTPNTPDDRLMLIAFVDFADGEQHIYVLNEEYRRTLVAALTGGVVLAGPEAHLGNGGG